MTTSSVNESQDENSSLTNQGRTTDASEKGTGQFWAAPRLPIPAGPLLPAWQGRAIALFLRPTPMAAVSPHPLVLCIALFLAGAGVSSAEPARLTLDSPHSLSGYVARLLLNETPFPGETSWVAEADTRTAQVAILNVLRNRLHHIPAGYSQHQLAAVTTDDAFDLITAGGIHGQVEGFYRDAMGNPVFSEHVRARIDYLVTVANRGAPGTFSRLIEYAQSLARAFASDFPADPFLTLQEINGEPVTGRAYGWMTDREYFRPGGRFIKITDRWGGGRGGNRFFTLRSQP